MVSEASSHSPDSSSIHHMNNLSGSCTNFSPKPYFFLLDRSEADFLICCRIRTSDTGFVLQIQDSYFRYRICTSDTGFVLQIQDFYFRYRIRTSSYSSGCRMNLGFGVLNHTEPHRNCPLSGTRGHCCKSTVLFTKSSFFRIIEDSGFNVQDPAFPVQDAGFRLDWSEPC